MRPCQHIAITVFDTYDILFAGDERRGGRFRALSSIFRFPRIPRLHNVVKRVRNRTKRFRCVFSSTDGYGILKELGGFRLGYIRFEIQPLRFVSFSNLVFTLHTPYTHVHLPAYCLRCPCVMVKSA